MNTIYKPKISGSSRRLSIVGPSLVYKLKLTESERIYLFKLYHTLSSKALHVQNFHKWVVAKLECRNSFSNTMLNHQILE